MASEVGACKHEHRDLTVDFAENVTAVCTWCGDEIDASDYVRGLEDIVRVARGVRIPKANWMWRKG